MTTRTPQEINDALDRLKNQVGALPDTNDLGTDIRILRGQVGTPTTPTTLSADVAALKSAVTTIQSPSWFKSHRTTGSWTSLTFAALSASLTASVTAGIAVSIGVGIAPFKIDEKGITIFGVTREMPWKKLVVDPLTKLQKRVKLLESEEQRQARLDAKNIKEKVAGLQVRMDKVDGKIRTAKSDLRGELSKRYGPLIGKVEKIELKLDAIKTAATNVRDSRAAATPHPRGVDSRKPLIAPVAKDVVALRDAVDVLVTALV